MWRQVLYNSAIRLNSLQQYFYVPYINTSESVCFSHFRVIISCFSTAQERNESWFSPFGDSSASNFVPRVELEFPPIWPEESIKS